MIAIIATLTAKPECADKVAALLSEAAGHVRSDAEPGCLEYHPTRTADDPTIFRVFEVYADKAALAAHRETEHFKPLAEAFGTMLAAPPTVEMLDVVA